MTRRPLCVSLWLAALALGLMAAAPAGPAPPAPSFESKLREVVGRHLGKPYVWGATGLKSYDCSGFVWRVALEAGVPLKRSTARRYFLWLKAPKPGEEKALGSLVFFNDLEHVGLVESGEAFYHAQTSKGTTRSPYAPYWGKRVSGYRVLPRP